MTTQPETVSTVDYPLARRSGLDPAPLLSELRRRDPIQRVRTAAGDAWLVTGYREVREVLGHPALGTQYPGAVPVPDADNLAVGFMFLKDPPEHTRLRRSVSKAFTARRMADLRVLATQRAAALVEEMVRLGPGVDLQQEFAFPLPIAIISELLGVPATDRDRFRAWADIVLRPTTSPPEAFAASFSDLQQFVVQLVAMKPDGPDLLSELALGSAGPGGLDRLEIASMAMGLLMAGYVTTATAISMGLLRLFAAPDLLARVRSGDVQLAPVVEELLRLQDEEIGIHRTVQDDAVICGVPMRRGETVVASRAGANRDPSEFPDPDSLAPDGGRSPHLAFGHGVHRCLGAALARMELEVAFGTLFAAVPALRPAVDVDEIEWVCDGMDVSLKRLPVTW